MDAADGPCTPGRGVPGIRTSLDPRGPSMIKVWITPTPGLLESHIPWQTRHGRAALLVYLADSADPSARSLALAQRRVFTAQLQAGILEADGALTHTNRVLPNVWPGVPQMDWIIGRVLDPGSPDPGEPLTVATSLAWAGRGNPWLVVLVLAHRRGPRSHGRSRRPRARAVGQRHRLGPPPPCGGCDADRLNPGGGGGTSPAVATPPSNALPRPRCAERPRAEAQGEAIDRRAGPVRPPAATPPAPLPWPPRVARDRRTRALR